MPKKKAKEQEGLGDTIAYLTELLAIDKLAKQVTKALNIEDCGCERRRDKLNKVFPYNKNKG